MKRPFAPVVLSFGIGSFLGLFAPFYPFLLKPFLPGLIILAWYFFLKKYEKTTLVLILLGFALAGFILSYEKKEKWDENPLRYLNYREYLDLEGTVWRAPESVRGGYYIYLKVKKLSFENKEKFLKGKVKLFVSKTDLELPELFPGDEILVSAQLTEMKRYSNPESRVERNLMIKGIHRTGKVKSPYLIKVLKRGSILNIKRIFSFIKFYLSSRINTALKGQEREFLKGALLGERNEIEDSVIESFQKTGIYHILAISGLHIGIISFILFQFLRFLGIPERKGYLILIAILVFYVFLLEGKSPILRASLIVILFLISKLIWKDHFFLNSLSLSALVLLYFNPHFIIEAGFLLTYSATFFIAIYTERIIRSLPFPDLRFKFLNKIYSEISLLFSMSVSATLGTLPIIALYFNRVVFASIFFNLLVIPIFIALVYLTIPWLLILIFSAKIASYLSIFIKIPILLILLISKIEVPDYLSFRIPAPHLMIFFFYFLSLSLIPFTKKLLKFLLEVTFISTLILICTYPFSSFSREFKVTFVDIGPGESTLVEFPGKEKMLIDGGGGMGDYDVGENILSPFLWSKGIKKIDYLVLSHAHPDHIGGLFSVAKNFKIKEVWVGTFPERDENFKKFIKILGTKTKERTSGFKKEIAGAKIEVFHPEKKRVEEVNNDDSVVLKITYGSFSFLFPGDIGVLAEKKIINKNFNLKSFVLKSPHHGSKTSSSEDFLGKVKPEFVVITQGTGSELPNKEVVKRYLNLGFHILRIQRDGMIEFKTDGKRIRWKLAKNSWEAGTRTPIP